MLRILYPMNLLLLLTHQVEAAWCEEWVIFGLPGGVQGFLLCNALLVIPLFMGSDAVAREAPQAWKYGALSASIGFIAIAIHTGFWLSGDRNFLLPASVLTFVGIAVTSVAIAAVCVRGK